MKSYFIKRILLIFVTAFIILSLTFILMKLLPDIAPAGFPAQVQAYYTDQVHMGYAKDFTTWGQMYIVLHEKKRILPG